MAMVKAHQIVIPPGQKVNKGELMLMLRQHWHGQVAMAHEMHSQASPTSPMPEPATSPPPGLHVEPKSKNVKKGYKRADTLKIRLGRILTNSLFLKIVYFLTIS